MNYSFYRAFRQQALDTVAIFRRQWLAPEAIRDWQDRALRTIVAHAYANVPFHRQRMQTLGLHPSDIQTVADVHKLPLSTRQEMRAGYPHQVVAGGYGRHNCIHEQTSGSSGEPLDVLHDQRAFDYSMALIYRHYHEVGYRLWQRRAYIRWQPFSHPLAIERIGLGRRSFIPLEADPQTQLKLLRQFQPHVISGYPSALAPLARQMTAADRAAIRPRMILTNSENLLPEDAQMIRAAFGCDIFDDYSSFELYQLAFECRAHRYHVVADNVIMEFLDSAGRPVTPGEEGEVVVTGLINRAMPFIRYRTGDLATPSAERCPCGRGLPVMGKINGRQDDLLLLASGRRLNPTLLSVELIAIDTIREYQLVQEQIDRLRARLVVDPAADPAAVARTVGDRLSRVVGAEPMTIDIQFVTRIERGATGKRKEVVVQPDVRAQAQALHGQIIRVAQD